MSYDTTNAPEFPQSLPDTKPLELPQTTNDWVEYSLQPYDGVTNAFPTTSTRTVTITVQQVGTYNTSSASFTNTLEWSENGDVWQTSRVHEPYLVNIYLNDESAIPGYDAALANGGWDPKTLAFPMRVGEIVDIIWQNNDGPSGGWDVHPFHAHRAHYWDLGSGNGTYNATANDAYLAQLRAETGYVPIKRDTMILYRYASSGAANTTAGWRAWRLSADDAGTWMLHCHILQHNGTQIGRDAPEPYIQRYLQYGGSVYGNASYDPIVNHYFEDKPDERCNGTTGNTGGWKR